MLRILPIRRHHMYWFWTSLENRNVCWPYESYRFWTSLDMFENHTGCLLGFNIRKYVTCAIFGSLLHMKKMHKESNFYWYHPQPFLKISFKLTKCGLSYSLKCNPRPFSECTRVCTIFYHWQPPKWGLKATIDRLEIQCWLKGEIVPNWISSLPMAAFKIQFGGCQW